MKRLAVLVFLLPTLAAAHDAAHPHLHPLGLTLAWGVAVAVGLAGAVRLARVPVPAAVVRAKAGCRP